MQQISTWWHSLAQREQQLVGACGFMLILGSLYWGIWTPIANAKADAERQLQAEQQTLNFVKQTANKIISLKQTASKTSNRGSLSNLVNADAARFNITITRMQPQGNKIQLWMDDVPFDNLLKYLDNLVNQQGLNLDTLDISATDEAGFVQVRRVELSRG